MRELTGGEGVAVVYDGVGQATFDGGLDALRPRGMMVLYGAASGPAARSTCTAAQRRLAVPHAPGPADYTATRDELLAARGDVFGWIADGRLDVRIGGRYPLEEARQAQEDLAAAGRRARCC